jgi:hypothetical protein
VTVLLDSAIGAILDNYADVIEGSRFWREDGRSAYRGIPGLYSNDPDLRNNDTIESSATVDASHIEISAPSTPYPPGKWSPVNGPAFWAVGKDGTLIGKHRKIIAWNAGTHQFTFDSEFDTVPQEGDTFTLRQGFKRVPSNIDIDRSPSGGFDRFFQLSATSGKVLRWSGNGLMTYQTELRLRLRILKCGRLHDAVASAMANLAIIRVALPRREHYEPQFTVMISPLDGGSSITKEDDEKIVVTDTYRLIYRINQAFDAVSSTGIS